MTEPDHPGSNPTWLSTTAVQSRGGWEISGRKWFVTGADGAAFAVVVAVTDPEAEPHRRASMFIIPTVQQGFRLVRNLKVMGYVGDGWASHAELQLDGCWVPADSLLGARGRGFLIAQDRLEVGRIHHCARWVGVAERAFDLMCARALARQLAPGELLASRQMIQDWIAESRAAIDAARLLVLQAAWSVDRRGDQSATAAVSAAKFHTAAVMTMVLDRAVQLHGALGLTDDTILSFLSRQERGARIYDGPDETHKLLVARRVLAAYSLRRLDTQ